MSWLHLTATIFSVQNTALDFSHRFEQSRKYNRRCYLRTSLFVPCSHPKYNEREHGEPACLAGDAGHHKAALMMSFAVEFLRERKLHKGHHGHTYAVLFGHNKKLLIYRWIVVLCSFFNFAVFESICNMAILL
ncbi:MAG: hypothetical protein PHY47_21980 [Lachnospiraceae bacterium]|nr:hypothetical protein [Lachnospiraceae bacterium]